MNLYLAVWIGGMIVGFVWLGFTYDDITDDAPVLAVVCWTLVLAAAVVVAPFWLAVRIGRRLRRNR